MISGPRNLLWLLPAALFFSWTLWNRPLATLLAPPAIQTESEIVAESGNGKSFGMEGVLLTQMQDGVRDWQIRAARLRTGRDENQLLLERLEAEFFKGTRRSFRITGGHGEYDTVKKQLEIRGQARVEAENGQLIVAERLHYDDQQKKIATGAPVRITSNNMAISGQGGMSYDMRGESYAVEGRVKVDIL